MYHGPCILHQNSLQPNLQTNPFTKAEDCEIRAKENNFFAVTMGKEKCFVTKLQLYRLSSFRFLLEQNLLSCF